MKYERLQIDSLLPAQSVSPLPGLGLFLMPDTVEMRIRFHTAVIPAFHESGLAATQALFPFSSDSSLDLVHQWITEAEVIVAEVSDRNPDVMYVLGLCHGIGRCPLLLTRDPFELPFNLRELRFVLYDDTAEGMTRLREQLTRAIRVFLAAARVMKDS